jgi:hypothetical protein
VIAIDLHEALLQLWVYSRHSARESHHLLTLARHALHHLLHLLVHLLLGHALLHHLLLRHSLVHHLLLRHSLIHHLLLRHSLLHSLVVHLDRGVGYVVDIACFCEYNNVTMD